MASFPLIFDNKNPPISHFFASVKLSILCYIKHVINNGEFIFFITKVTYVYHRSYKKIYTSKRNLLAYNHGESITSDILVLRFVCKYTETCVIYSLLLNGSNMH